MRSNDSRKWISQNALCSKIVFGGLFVFAFISIVKNDKNLPRQLSSSWSQSLSTLTYDLAFNQSFGFFDDISESSWRLMQSRAQNGSLFRDNPPGLGIGRTQFWFMNNVDPLFTCLHMRRVGGFGDGPKWVCDPHRLLKKKDCLVYSIGSNGNYAFEDGLYDILGNHCETHVFDPNPGFGQKSNAASRNIHFHSWGLKPSYKPMQKPVLMGKKNNAWIYKSLQDTIEELNHYDRRIDLFKIDCEGCEWSLLDDIIDPELDIRQIMVETHPRVLIDGDTSIVVPGFYQKLLQRGFVPFSKEVNTHGALKGTGEYEYAFIRLDPAFLQSTPTSSQAI